MNPRSAIISKTYPFRRDAEGNRICAVCGPARAFVEHRLIGPGRTVADLSDESAVDLANAMPRLLPERSER